MAPSQLVGRTGTVTMSIAGDDTLGEVEVRFAGGTQRFLARGVEPIEVDAAILVIAESPGRIVDVEKWVQPPGW
ncbi:hypothetical protein [Gordonia sp. 'Campus']|uniref:hypothetical protein n=1 Tax=Gordonia sp. 'Campus' TaxID=2915824 RepID=UPI001EE3BDE1|nr:hypothetical protein [Gordonia sp. 'Campus']